MPRAWTCDESHERQSLAERFLDGELAVDLQRLAVDRDPAAAAQVADHVPVHGRVVLAPGLRIRHADREVDRAADLLVEQDLLREAVDPVVRADAELAEAARARRRCRAS